MIQVISLPLPSEYAASKTFSTKHGFASVPPEAFRKRSQHVDLIDAAGAGGDEAAAEHILNKAIQIGLQKFASTSNPPLSAALDSKLGSR